MDIVSTLQSLQMLKYWKGKHLVLKRQVGTPTSSHFCAAGVLIVPTNSLFCPPKDLIDDWKAKETKRGNGKTIDPTALKWTPPKGT